MCWDEGDILSLNLEEVSSELLMIFSIFHFVFSLFDPLSIMQMAVERVKERQVWKMSSAVYWYKAEKVGLQEFN